MNTNEPITQQDRNATQALVEAHFQKVERSCLRTTRWMLLFALAHWALPIAFVLVLGHINAPFHWVQAICFSALVGLAVIVTHRYRHINDLYRKVRLYRQERGF